MMSVSGITSTSAAAANTVSSEKNNAFDTDTFMKLLLAQLKNQDPLSPMDNNQMVAQMAQLNSLQQLTSISTNIEKIKDYIETITIIVG
ncbi:MAG: flagellar hook capping FlgD N-terminal domain-containing protein [Anaerolineaceae bacterium]